MKEDVSLIDDSTTVTVSKEADGEVRGWSDMQDRPVLVLRHKEGRVDAYIVTKLLAAAGRSEDEVPCTLRFDKDKAVEISLATSADGEAIFFAFPRNWIYRMTKSTRLVFRFTPFRSAPQTTSFDLRGLAEAIKPLEKAARWKIGSCEDLWSRHIASHASLLAMLGYCPKAEDDAYTLSMHLNADVLFRGPELRAAACEAILGTFTEDHGIAEGATLPEEWGVLATLYKRTIPDGREGEIIEALREAAKTNKIDGRLTIRTAEEMSEHPVRVELTGIPSGFQKGEDVPDSKQRTDADK